jgi:hypothetical protein
MILDLDSPASITLGPVFKISIPLVLALFSDESVKCRYTSKQTIYFCYTLLYEKENKIRKMTLLNGCAYQEKRQ